jgi:isopentenyl diphosphate isomerase/L-lactate dehydrogenase-like FMN-dependent dehydrogenase
VPGKVRELISLIDFRFPRFPSRDRRLAKALTIWDLRKIAKRRTPKAPFDYTDGSAESESSLTRARQTFSEIQFNPRILKDVSQIDISTTVLGKKVALPFGIAPTGFTRMMHTDGEIAGAKAAEKYGIPFCLSTLGTTSIENVVEHAPEGINWFQLYMWKDRVASLKLVDRAQKAGVENLVLTVDVPVAGARLRDVRNGLTVPPKINLKTLLNAAPRVEWWWKFLTKPSLEFASMSNWDGTVAELLDFMFDPTMTFEDLKWIRKIWSGKLTVKGIQNLEDAIKAEKCGADAIVFSNHGGRQLDKAPTPLHLIPLAKQKLSGKTEIHMDTGIMSGSDIVAALALGADFVYIGRAYLYGLMAGGQSGVERTIEILHSEIVRTMKLLGANSISQLNEKMVSVPSISTYRS